MVTTDMKIIDEIRQITGDAVAKKQDAAKLNYPKIIEDIKLAAQRGESSTTISVSRMNEYDKQLLEKDGFFVRLQDVKRHPYENFTGISQYTTLKEWLIQW